MKELHVKDSTDNVIVIRDTNKINEGKLNTNSGQESLRGNSDQIRLAE